MQLQIRSIVNPATSWLPPERLKCTKLSPLAFPPKGSTRVKPPARSTGRPGHRAIHLLSKRNYSDMASYSALLQSETGASLGQHFRDAAISRHPVVDDVFEQLVGSKRHRNGTLQCTRMADVRRHQRRRNRGHQRLPKVVPQSARWGHGK